MVYQSGKHGEATSNVDSSGVYQSGSHGTAVKTPVQNPNKFFFGSSGTRARATTASGDTAVTFGTSASGGLGQAETIAVQSAANKQRQRSIAAQQSAQKSVYSPAQVYADTHSFQEAKIKTYKRDGNVIGYESPQERQSVSASKGSYYKRQDLTQHKRRLAASKIIEREERKPEIFSEQSFFADTHSYAYEPIVNVGRGVHDPYKKQSYGYSGDLESLSKMAKVSKAAELIPSAQAAQEETIAPQGFDYRKYMRESIGLKRQTTVVNVDGTRIMKFKGEDEFGAYALPIKFEGFFKDMPRTTIDYVDGKPILKLKEQKESRGFETRYQTTPQDVYSVEQLPLMAGSTGLGWLFGAGATLLSSVGAKTATTVDVVGKGLFGVYAGTKAFEIGSPIYQGIKEKDMTQVDLGLRRTADTVVQMTGFKWGAKSSSNLLISSGVKPKQSLLPKVKFRSITVESAESEVIPQEALFQKNYKVEPLTISNEKTLYRGFQVERVQGTGIKTRNIVGYKKGYVVIGSTPKLDFSKYPDTTFTMESLANPMTAKAALRSSNWATETDVMTGGKKQFELLTKIESSTKKTPITVYKGIEKVESFKTDEAFVYYLENLGTTYKSLEFGARGKASSIGTLRINKAGQLYTAPETHRSKDVGDYFVLKAEQIMRQKGSMKDLNELKSLYGYKSEPIKNKVDFDYIEQVNLRNPFRTMRTFLLKPAAENYGFVGYKAQVSGTTRASGDIDTDLAKSEAFAMSYAKSEARTLKVKFGEKTFWKMDQPFLIQTTQGGKAHLGDIHPRGASEYAQAPESFYGMQYDLRTANIKNIKLYKTGADRKVTFKQPQIEQYIEPKSKLPLMSKQNLLTYGLPQLTYSSAPKTTQLQFKPQDFKITSTRSSRSALPLTKISASQIPSPKVKRSLSLSSSVSPSLSASPSKSLSKSLSMSPSRSLSKSLSMSPSMSMSKSMSPSRSLSKSLSMSPSMSMSKSMSPSRSPSRSRSVPVSLLPTQTKEPPFKLNFDGIMRKSKKKSKSEATFKDMKLPTLDVSFGLSKSRSKYPTIVTGLEQRPFAL